MTTTIEGPHAGLDEGAPVPVNTAGMAQGARDARSDPGTGQRCSVELVVPVYNEETDLEPGIERLHDYLQASFPLTYRITIADNASTDRTWRIAQSLAARIPAVHAIHLD